MFNDQREQFQRNSAFRKLQGRSQSFEYNVLDPSHSFSSEMMQVINAQNSLIMKLLQRQNVLYNQLNKRFSSSDSGSGSNTRPNKNTEPTRYREYNNSEQFSLSSSNRSGEQNGTKAQPKIIQNQRIFQGFDNVNNRAPFKSDMESSPEDGGDLRQGQSAKFSEKRKQTQTKNMIKNFAKAIFSFIRKNREKRLQVLKSLQIPQDEFMRVYESFKGHIHSITELRSLWTPQGNLFHKAFRILSYIYLQRHCLQKTFNSRVENYSIHLKYRQRLLKALQFPEEFTALKVN